MCQKVGGPVPLVVAQNEMTLGFHNEVSPRFLVCFYGKYTSYAL